MRNKPAKMANITRGQELALRATRLAQQTVRFATLGKVRPHWVLPLAGHFCVKNQTKEIQDSGDSEPGLPSHRWCKEIKHMTTSRYKRIATILAN